MGSTTLHVLQSANFLSSWPVDWMIIGAFAVLVALDAWRSGSSRATTLALAAPLALVLSTTLPQAALIGPVTKQLSANAEQALLFGAVFVVLFILLYRMMYAFSEIGGILQALLAGVATAAAVVVVWLQIPALVSLWHFGPQVQLIFGEAYRFWWLVAAYAALAFVRS